MTSKMGKAVDKSSRKKTPGRKVAGAPMPVEQRTPNPLPDKDYTGKQQAFVDEDEAGPEHTEGEE